MAKKRVAQWIIVLLALAALAGGIVFFWMSEKKTYTQTEQAFPNALMGYAPRADNSDYTGMSLRYVDVTWRELEPEEGKFDWNAIEKKNQLNELKSEGVHLVLRFVCDLPSSEAHMDIPDWLYERTGDGAEYDTSYGKGYSPDYNNPEFIAAHHRALAALGEYFDGFAAYVELGSLGHWGEWHIKYDDVLIRMPKEDVRNLYIQDYIDAFPTAKLMMRRPFNEAAEEGMGLYNDMAGNEKATEEWLTWIENGGDYWETDEENALSAMPDFWKTAPSGGEMTSSTPMQEMLETELARTLELLHQSHMTFLGPKIADKTYEEGYQAVLGELGYRLWISQATLQPSLRGTQLTMTWRNDGAAPFYGNWTAYVYVLDENGSVLEMRRIPLELPTLLPQESKTVSVSLGSDGLLPRKKSALRVAVGIIDPMNNQNAVRLAMEAESENGMTILFDADH